MQLLEKRIGQICDADANSEWREKYDIEMVVGLYTLFLKERD